MLPQYFTMPLFELAAIAPKDIVPGYAARFVHTETMTFSHLDIIAGSTIADHAHIHEQVSQVVEGIFELTVNGEIFRMQPGQVVVIPYNARHSGVAITNCKVLDVFSPVREDYKNLI